MLVYQKLNKDNYKDVLNIKHQLFPESNSDNDYEEYFIDDSKSNYYLILKDGCACATIGWYEYNSKNAFVGWFGVLPEFQQKGIGHEILNYIIVEVKKMKYDYLRVYTDKVVNYASTKLYDKIFDLKEDYTYPDKIGSTNNFVIYTKFLGDEKEEWNNTPLNEDFNYDF